MRMNNRNPKVDAFLRRARNWRDELAKLRAVILECGLAEELKWGIPVYTFQNKNIVGINGLKNFCALAFFKGVLLKDSKRILARPGQHTQAARWVKFTSLQEIAGKTATLKSYIRDAIEIEKAGVKIKLKKTPDFKVPEEFQTKLAEAPKLKAAFEALTPGRQRAYLFYFSGAKQSKTRAARVEKCLRQILNGKGLNDR